jgi:hypothetical protein
MITFFQGRKKFVLTQARLSEGEFKGLASPRLWFHQGAAFNSEIKWAVTGKDLRKAFQRTEEEGNVFVVFERTRRYRHKPKNSRITRMGGFTACAKDRRIGCTNFSPRNWKLILKTLGVK